MKIKKEDLTALDKILDFVVSMEEKELNKSVDRVIKLRNNLGEELK